jgi:hypothetical protein
LKQPANKHLKTAYLPTSLQTFLNRLIWYNFTAAVAAMTPAVNLHLHCTE